MNEINICISETRLEGGYSPPYGVSDSIFIGTNLTDATCTFVKAQLLLPVTSIEVDAALLLQNPRFKRNRTNTFIAALRFKGMFISIVPMHVINFSRAGPPLYAATRNSLLAKAYMVWLCIKILMLGT